MLVSDMTSPLDSIVDLLGKLKARCGMHECETFVIFGSAAIVLNGVDLGRSVEDLDLFVSNDVFARLAEHFDVLYKGENGRGAHVAPLQGTEIEIFKSFKGVEFDGVYARSRLTVNSSGFRVAVLDDIRTWKQALARKKDIDDIAVIERFLATDIRGST